MRLPRCVARLAAVSVFAIGIGLSSPTAASASASGFCYAYNYSDSRAISHAAYEIITETVWYTMTFDCYGRALTIKVTHIHDYYGVSRAPDHPVWHGAHSTSLNRQQYYDVAWDDNYGPGWYNAGSVQKDEYPNVTIPYNYYANTLTGLWMCGVQHADDCTFRHFFVAGYAQEY